MGVIKENDKLPEFEIKLKLQGTTGFLKKILLVGPIVLISLYVGVVNYTFFHLIVELVGIFVGIGIAVAVYHSSKILKNGLYMYLATMFLSISLFQIMHVFSYKGINIFPWNNYNLAIQISIGAKYLDIFSLLIISFLPLNIINNKKNIKVIAVSHFMFTSFIVFSILHFKIFPKCAYDNAVPTVFKIASEYITLSIYILILTIVCIRKSKFGDTVFNSVFSFLALKLFSEVLFVSCGQVNDVANVLAHLLRFSAYLIIYNTVSMNAVTEPIMRLLKELDRTNKELEQKTVQLQLTNNQLRSEIEECLRVEDLLRKSEERYKSLLDFLPDAVFVNDRENVLFVNNSGLRFFGYKNKEQVEGRPLDKIFDKLNCNSYLLKLDEVIRYNCPIVFEQKMLNNDGSICFEIITTKYNIDDKLAFLSVIRDVTHRKHFEEMKRNVAENDRLLREVTEMSKTKTQHFANLSHEFRTPLSVMLCTLQIMESVYKSGSSQVLEKEKILQYIASMKSNSYRLLKNVNNLLEITKIESGYDKLRLENHNIVRVVEKVTTSVSEYTRNRKIGLLFDTDQEELIMAFDIDKIERILLNLLSNAIKCTREGGHIEVNVHRQTHNVLITVSDTGIGIPEDKLELIFERFEQVDNSLTGDHEGTGMGLSLVRSLVEMHGGNIRVESNLGVGSKFSVLLPVRVLKDKECFSDSETDTKIESGIDEKINIELSNIYR